MPKLHVTSPSSLAKTIDLTSNLLTIGRTAESDIHIHDHNVSKRHGILVRDGDDYQIHDFNSTNGTFVNGERIMAVKLQHGASIRLGPVELRYESLPTETNAGPLGGDSTEGMQPLPPRQRGMAKKMKPEFAGSKLQSGPVTITPGSLAKPIPPAEK